jgi:hypothetical protein
MTTAPPTSHDTYAHQLERVLGIARNAGTLAAAIALLAIACVVALAAIVIVVRARTARRESDGARLVTIAVPPHAERDGAELLWLAMHDLLRPRLARLLHGQLQLAWELAADDQGTRFRLWIPGSVPPGLIERTIAAAWPGTTVTTSDANLDQLVDDGGAFAATALAFSGPGWFSLRCDGPDPQRLLVGQLATLTAGERALVQIVARPATTRQQRRLVAAARRIRTGTARPNLNRLLEPSTARAARTPRIDPAAGADARAVLEKAGQPLFDCAIRIAVGAPSREVARGRIHALATAFAAYEGRVGLRRRHLRHPHPALNSRTLGRRGFLVSLAELAALAHLPTDPTAPGVLRAGARSVAPPPGLPAEGKALGTSSSGAPVALAVADARQHLHLLGPTGVGKSTLIARLALDDLAHGRGAVVIDPKGDLVEDILARIPSGLEERVDLLDPLDPAPPGLNVLQGDDPELVVDQLVGIFRRVYEQFWGPRTDDILRAALLTLTHTSGPATLADVTPLLTDQRYRSRLLAELDDPVGLEPFWDWYEQLGESARAQATGPVLNKLRAFLLRRSVRAIVGQERSTIDVPACLDHGRLLLLRLPKGTLGEDTSRLLGSFVVARVWQAALARANRPKHDRPDCALYVDEVHTYLTLPTPLADMLAEARGYHLSICLAHQHLGQLPKEMREAIAANTRSKLYFQLSTPDANALGRELEPELAAHDLANLPRHTAAARLCVNGETGRPFTLHTTPLPPPSAARAEALRRASRTRIGVARSTVEQQLATRLHGHARGAAGW